MSKTLVATLPFLLALNACSDDDGSSATGRISVRAYGEALIEDGIPAEDVDDGWAISFERFEVSVRDVVVAGVALPGPHRVDLSARSDGAGHELESISAAAREHRQPGFTLARLEIEGAAERDGTTKTFDWVFDSATRYEKCQTRIAVQAEQTTTFQITVHADHLFYDSLVAERPLLLFQPLADADTDQGGAITRAELGATDIGAYDPGNQDVSELWTWLVAQSRTLGHVDGEGHCEAHAAD